MIANGGDGAPGGSERVSVILARRKAIVMVRKTSIDDVQQRYELARRVSDALVHPYTVT